MYWLILAVHNFVLCTELQNSQKKIAKQMVKSLFKKKSVFESSLFAKV